MQANGFPSRTSILTAAARALGSREPDPSVRNPDWAADRLIGPAESALITDHPIGTALDRNFDDAINDALCNHDFSRDIESAVENHDFSREIEQAVEDKMEEVGTPDVKDAVSEAVRAELRKNQVGFKDVTVEPGRAVVVTLRDAAGLTSTVTNFFIAD